MRRSLPLGIALFLVTAFASAAKAAPVIICVEDAVTGCVAEIPTSAPPILVASDGESSFDPFGAGFDTSDGILFPFAGWVYVGEPGWIEVSPTLWVLPSTIPNCGTENEPECEPLGAWLLPGSFWAAGTPDLLHMLEADTLALSDVIKVFNSTNGAMITFQSDPFPVPEPATLTLFGGGLAAAIYRRRRVARS